MTRCYHVNRKIAMYHIQFITLPYDRICIILIPSPFLNPTLNIILIAQQGILKQIYQTQAFILWKQNTTHICVIGLEVCASPIGGSLLPVSSRVQEEVNTQGHFINFIKVENCPLAVTRTHAYSVPPMPDHYISLGLCYLAQK